MVERNGALEIAVRRGYLTLVAPHHFSNHKRDNQKASHLRLLDSDLRHEMRLLSLILRNDNSLLPAVLEIGYATGGMHLNPARHNVNDSAPIAVVSFLRPHRPLSF